MARRCVLVKPYFPNSFRKAKAIRRRGREVTVSPENHCLIHRHSIVSDFSLVLQQTLHWPARPARLAFTKCHRLHGWPPEMDCLLAVEASCSSLLHAGKVGSFWELWGKHICARPPSLASDGCPFVFSRLWPSMSKWPLFLGHQLYWIGARPNDFIFCKNALFPNKVLLWGTWGSGFNIFFEGIGRSNSTYRKCHKTTGGSLVPLFI